MLRAVLLALAVLATQVAASGAIGPGTACPERCPNDGPDGRCPPVCMTCPCSSHPVPLLPAPVAEVSSAPREFVPARRIPHPPAPDPHDIFHVPKPLLA